MTKMLLTGVLLALSGADAVKVGVLLPLTGPGSVSGQAAKNGYLLALDEINRAGGVLGQPLDVVFADDGSSPAKAVPEFVRLVTVDKLDYFKYLKRTHQAKNIAIAYEDGPFGSAGINDTIAAFKKAGFNVVMSEKFKTGSGNFGPLVSKAKAAKPDRSATTRTPCLLPPRSSSRTWTWA